MRKIQQPPAQEIIYGSATPKESVAISREVRTGRLRRIAPKLYTTNLKDRPRESAGTCTASSRAIIRTRW